MEAEAEQEDVINDSLSQNVTASSPNNNVQEIQAVDVDESHETVAQILHSEQQSEEKVLDEDKIKSIIDVLTTDDVTMTSNSDVITEEEMNQFLDYVERGKLDGQQLDFLIQAEEQAAAAAAAAAGVVNRKRSNEDEEEESEDEVAKRNKVANDFQVGSYFDILFAPISWFDTY